MLKNGCFFVERLQSKSQRWITVEGFFFFFAGIVSKHVQSGSSKVGEAVDLYTALYISRCTADEAEQGSVV